MQEGPASLVAPIDKLSILVTVGLVAWLFSERVTMTQATLPR